MNGKVPAVLFKVIAVVSALAIGGGYVSWRSAEAEKENQRKSAERAKGKVENEEDEMALMVGSKSPGGSVFTKEMAQEGIDSSGRTASDFIRPVSPSDDSILPEIEDDEPAEQELLPSSKIGIMVMPKILKEKEGAEEEAKKLLPSSKSAPIELLKEFIDPEKPE